MNQRKIAAALRESVFAPNKPGPLKVVADVGNADYYILRAIEEAGNASATMKEYRALRKSQLTKAISLLALAKVTLDEEHPGDAKRI